MKSFVKQIEFWDPAETKNWIRIRVPRGSYLTIEEGYHHKYLTKTKHTTDNNIGQTMFFVYVLHVKLGVKMTFNMTHT